MWSWACRQAIQEITLDALEIQRSFEHSIIFLEWIIETPYVEPKSHGPHPKSPFPGTRAGTSSVRSKCLLRLDHFLHTSLDNRAADGQGGNGLECRCLCFAKHA